MQVKLEQRNYVHKIERGVHQVHDEIDIETPAEHVFDVLTDFTAMSEWSTKWVGNEGPFELDEICTCIYRIGKREMRFTHKIMELVPGRKFAWSGKTIAGMRDYHSFEMRPVTKTSCVLIQEDLARGGLALLIGKIVKNSNINDYTEFNAEIKARAEATWPSQN